MSEAPVRFATADGVLRITLDRPSHKNSLTPASVRAIVEALEAAAADDALRAVWLGSSGAEARTQSSRRPLRGYVGGPPSSGSRATRPSRVERRRVGLPTDASALKSPSTRCGPTRVESVSPTSAIWRRRIASLA